MPSEVLLSRQVTLTVPSPLEGLTTVFGMGTGVTLPLISPGKLNERIFLRIHPEVRSAEEPQT